MRILIIQDWLRGGGTEHQSVALARDWQARGHWVRLLTFRPGGTLRPLLGEPGAAGAIPVLSLQGRDSGLNWWAPGLSRAVERCRPDVVLLMGRNANSYGWLLKRGVLGDLPVFGTVRTGRPLPFFYRKSLAAVSGVVANSRYAAERVVGLGIPAERVKVIHNGVRLDADGEVFGEPGALRQRFSLPRDRFVVLCLGRLRPRKGQSFLLDVVASWKEGPRPLLWMVGEGEDAGILRARIKAEGLEGVARVDDYLKDPGAAILAADAVALASEEESLPNALLEAQWLGRPVVALDRAGVGECFEDGQTGLLLAERVEEDWRKAIQRLMDHPFETEAMGERARARAREKFAFGERAADYLALFETKGG
jgi:glycosyltransferase involved in cell wall biosynthesis